MNELCKVIMRVLVACEFSGIVRSAFEALGHDAWSCDMLPSERPGNHLQDDILHHLDEGWDMMIAHPPCTRLCNSGVRWLDERDLWGEMDDACWFFATLLYAPIPKVAIENPIPHRYAVRGIGRKYDQIVQPWMFGHPETKAICLWLRGLPNLTPTKKVEGREHRVHRESSCRERWKHRSRFFSGVADAMASQWG